MIISDNKKKVNINIKTTQDNETTTWESEGILYQENGMHIIVYPDYSSNTATDNTLELSADRMHILRNGAITSDMLFEEHMITQGEYSVMFYNSDIEVYTLSYEFAELDNMIKVHAKYQLFMSGDLLAENEIEIEISII